MDDSDDSVVRTWDGVPVSPDPPFGAMIVVYRWDDNQPTFFILHRAQFGPDFDGDWAWGPPSGARYPGEAIDTCAARELFEKTGFDLALSRVTGNSVDWIVYLAEDIEGAKPRLSAEHDTYAWCSFDEAAICISPKSVRDQFTAAVSQICQ